MEIRTAEGAPGSSTTKLLRNRWGRIHFCRIPAVCIRSTYLKHITNSSSHNYCNLCNRDFGTNDGLHQVLRLLPSDVLLISLLKALPEFILPWRQRLPQMQHWVRRRRRARRGKHHLPFTNQHSFLRSQHVKDEHPYCQRCKRDFVNESALKQVNNEPKKRVFALTLVESTIVTLETMTTWTAISVTSILKVAAHYTRCGYLYDPVARYAQLFPTAPGQFIGPLTWTAGCAPYVSYIAHRVRPTTICVILNFLSIAMPSGL